MKSSVFLISIALLSCSSGQENDSVEQFFDEADLGAFGSDTRLYLNAHFSECGEWGGHNENMVIYAKEDKEFYLDYQKFSVDCDKRNNNDGTPVQVLERTKTLKLNKDEKKSVSDYIQRMIKSKIEERFPGHAGNLFSVIKSDSTLLIEVYDSKEYDINSYNRLLKTLKLYTTVKR